MKKQPENNLYDLSPEQIVEYSLCQLEKANKKLRLFHKNYQDYLATQRELFLSEILSSLKKVGNVKEKGLFHRVVLSKYMNDPLCMYGSVLVSKRFNFGNDLPYDFCSFPCLYLSSSQEGAKLEKFPNKKQTGLSSEEISLIASNNSYLTSRCEVNLEKCIDLRTKESLEDFTKIISKIKTPIEFQNKWKKINKKLFNKSKKQIDPLNTIQSSDELYRSLFEIYYTQWVAWLDIPSNSQWFGCYVKEAGIEAVIYPSLRENNCYNLAVYPKNFGNKSYIRLKDDHNSVPTDRTKINNKNYKFFELEVPSKSLLIQ